MMENNAIEKRQDNDQSKLDAPIMKVDAAIDTQIMTAKSFPRDLKKCMENILETATIDSDIAESCFYVLPPRSGQQESIKGPSVRLAEICASFWGNLQVGTKVISNDGRHIVVEGWAWDLERNLKFSSEISKSIKTKEGKTYTASMQATTIAAASSIALRNAIFKIVPQVFVEKAYKKCMEITQNENEFNKRRSKTFERMIALGVNKEIILDFYKIKTIDEITPDQLTEIIGIGTSIKEGYIKKEEAFCFDAKTGEVYAKLEDRLIESENKE